MKALLSLLLYKLSEASTLPRSSNFRASGHLSVSLLLGFKIKNSLEFLLREHLDLRRAEQLAALAS